MAGEGKNPRIQKSPPTFIRKIIKHIIMNKQIAIYAAIFIVAAGGGFMGGMKYQQSKTPASVAGRTGAGGAGGFGGGGRRFGGANGGSFVNGQVLSKDNNSITVKNMAGGSQIVILGSSTQYRKAVDGTATDVIVGGAVTVTGTTNSDGSLTAQSVQIRSASSTPPNFPPQNNQ
jgi:hypothetical protein